MTEASLMHLALPSLWCLQVRALLALTSVTWPHRALEALTEALTWRLCSQSGPLLQVLISVRSFYRTPHPLGKDAAPELFSEGRAREHVNMLSEVIGHRTVGDFHRLLHAAVAWRPASWATQHQTQSSFVQSSGCSMPTLPAW